MNTEIMGRINSIGLDFLHNIRVHHLVGRNGEGRRFACIENGTIANVWFIAHYLSTYIILLTTLLDIYARNACPAAYP
jgi:hypothetical protein